MSLCPCTANHAINTCANVPESPHDENETLSTPMRVQNYNC
jgi:hypothetical protein